MKIFAILFLTTCSFLVSASTNQLREIKNTGNVLNQEAKGRSQTLSFRDYLEMASFGATTLTAVVALFALKQLRLARLQFGIASATLKVAQDDIKIRSRREAVSLAAKQCEDFGDVILPKLNGWRDEISNKGVEIKDWQLLNKAFDQSSLKDNEAGKAWVQKLQAKQLGMTACKILNQCEAFSIYFATGAADEEVAFPVVGPIFCNYVAIFAPWLIAMRSHNADGFTSGKFANTVRLYEIWADRIRLEEIEAHNRQAQKEIGTLKNEKIKPIGAE